MISKLSPFSFFVLLPSRVCIFPLWCYSIFCLAWIFLMRCFERYLYVLFMLSELLFLNGILLAFLFTTFSIILDLNFLFIMNSFLHFKRPSVVSGIIKIQHCCVELWKEYFYKLKFLEKWNAIKEIESHMYELCNIRIKVYLALFLGK